MRSSFLIFVLLCAACGDDRRTTTDAGDVDGGTTPQMDGTSQDLSTIDGGPRVDPDSGEEAPDLGGELPDSGSDAGSVCTPAMAADGRKLRIELSWDTQGEGNGDTDVDLHLHRRSVPAGVATGESDFFGDDDCYYANCKGSSYDASLRMAWDLDDSADLAACRTDPHGEGAEWVDRGACANPRLDVDVINCDPAEHDPDSSDFCAPELLNVDSTRTDDTYRVMVHYFDSAGQPTAGTNARVKVFCGGMMVRDLSTSLTMTDDIWYVADVAMLAPTCDGTPTCIVMPVSAAATQPTNDHEFGPPWSF